MGDTVYNRLLNLIFTEHEQFILSAVSELPLSRILSSQRSLLYKDSANMDEVVTPGGN